MQRNNNMSSHTVIPKFPQAKDSLHSELRRRVQEYFTDNNIGQTGNTSLLLKALLMVTSFALVYTHLVFFTPVWYWAIAECLLLGVIISAIGFNVLHDGSHGSFSNNKLTCKMAAYSISMLGASHYMWNMKHNMIHHTYTNVDGVDDDIALAHLMRLSPEQKKNKLHKFQYLYFGVLYMLLYVFWVFYSDYAKYFKGFIGITPLKKMSLTDHIMFWAVKVYHAIVFVVVPIIFVGFWYWLIGFLIASCLAGFILSIVFQLAHTVEHTAFPVADIDTNKLPDEFAIHQIKTTANFATKNKIVSWFVGGLNFQIEHHLFPKISHVHYPAISKIVKAVCMEYQLNYIEYPSVQSAVVAHVKFLKRMGNS